MTQAMEAPVLTGPCGLGLRQVLVEVMEEVQQSVEQDVGGAGLLHTLLSSAWLQALLQVFEGLHRFRRQSPTPALTCASGLSLQLQSDLSSLSGGSEEVQELNHLLRQPHLQALFWAHDSVAQKDYEPVLPPMPQEVPADQEATRTVCLVKNKQPLGATIKRNDITGEIFVARVIYGGLAQRSGLLHAGDRILEVNGLPVDGMEPEQVIQTVQARSTGTIMFRVVPITERPVHSQTMLYLRALVDYSPQQDPSIPCADAGMGFQRGEVLEVVDQTDALWWQAQRLPPSGGCAGLVPSASLLRRKQREHWWSQPYQLHSCTQTLSTVEEEDMMADDKCVEADEEASDSEELREEEGEFGSSSGLYIAGFRRSLRQCRRRSHSTTQPSCSTRCPGSTALSSPYEEVVRYQRGPGETHRLVALMGAPGVGVNELRRRLIAADPALYQGATPHTTRAPRSHEENGREYNFISRELFDNMVYNNRFLEYGEFQGSLYGTSIQAVKEVLTAGKTCVIDIEPNAIQAVRTPELKAFIVFIKPPSAERLRETRQEAVITSACSATRPFTDVDYRDLVEASRRMESHYSQYLDRVVLSEELGPSTALLRGAVQQAQDLPQWVPAAWIRPPEES